LLILIIILIFRHHKSMIYKFVIWIWIILFLLKTTSYCNFSVAVCMNSTDKHQFFWKIVLKFIIFRRIFILAIAWLWFYFYLRFSLIYLRSWLFFNFFIISTIILNFFKLILSLLIYPKFIQIFSFFTYKCLVCNFKMFWLITKFLSLILFPYQFLLKIRSW
jgi:hypothetical protein